MDGIVLADKPAGISSHALVGRARAALANRRIGHAGTLDPFATGLLILLIGRATRTQRLFVELPKIYEVVARLGATSTTGDPEGEIVETGVLPPQPLALPTGEVRQRPPAFSAVKIGGVRAYKRARRGEDVEVPERTVRVESFEQLWREADRAAFRIVCSAGTYVRSLIADLGDAYCLELRRTAIGPFSVDGGWTGDGPPPPLIALDAALEQLMPRLLLGADDARAVAHGRALSIPAPGDRVLLCDTDGAVAVAERDGPQLRPVIGFRG